MESKLSTPDTKKSPDPDLIRGRRNIGREIGISDRTVCSWHARRVIPTFTIEGTLFMRRSTWRERMRRLEQGEGPEPQPEQPPRRKRGWPKGRKRGPRKVPTPTPTSSAE
jgi:hypothetical protein